MRRPAMGSPFGVLFLFYLLAFAFFVARSLFTFPEQELLAAFMWPYLWSNAFLELTRYAIPLTLAGTAVAYSLLSSPPVVGRTPIHRVIASHLVGIVSVAVVYTAISIGVQPLVQHHREQLFSLSRQARTYLDQAESARATGDKASAVQGYERYLAIDGENREVQSLAAELQSELYGGARRPEVEEGGERPSLSGDLTEGLSPAQHLDRARGFLEQGDYFTAYYYADLAVRIDPGRADARRLAARAQQMIREFDLAPLAELAARIFERKRRGFDFYNTGEYVKAYRVFFALNQEVPRDAEAAKYLELSRNRLAGQAFFLDEAAAAEAMPGAERLLFLNPRRDDLHEIVYLGKVAETPDGVYFVDIEVAGFTSKELLYHYGAAYGKLSGDQVNFYGIDRRDPRREARSTLYRGRPPVGAGEVPDTLALVPEFTILTTLKTQRRSLDDLSFATLWRVRNRIADFGHLEAPVGLEILQRVLMPFSFLVLTLVGMSVGWRFRATPSRRPRWPAYVLMPMFPLLALYLSSFYLFAQKVILAFIMVRIGFLVSLVVLVGLQALALFLALIALAGQRSD